MASSQRELPTRTRKNIHPGAIVNDNKQKRRTKAEIDADKARKKTEDEQKAAAIIEARKLAIQKSAAKEDEVQQKELEARKHANRPDLPTMAAFHEEKARKLEASEMDIEDDEVNTLDADDVPPASSAGTDSEGDSRIEDFDDGDYEKDIDYVGSQDEKMDTDEEWQEFIRARGGRKKDKPKVVKPTRKEERDLLRSQIDSARVHAPTSTIVAPTTKHKRKATSEIQPASEETAAPSAEEQAPKPNGKRVKPAEVGGLKPNWKKQVGLVKPKASTASRRESSPDDVPPDHDDDAAADNGGEFAHDETPQSLAASRAQKSSKGPSRRTAEGGLKETGTAKMGVSLKEVNLEETKGAVTAGARKSRTPRYKNADLPLPHPNDLKIWQGEILGSITDWAGTLDEPFHPNSQPEFHGIVDECWSMGFDGKVKPNDAVYYVAASALRNWRSNIGKRALKFYQSKFAKSPFKNSPETIKAYVKDALSKLVVDGREYGLKFLYRDPRAGTGAYRSDAIVAIFSVHLQIILRTDGTYGDPTGALSVCCAAAERALKAWETGYPPQQADDDSDDNENATNSGGVSLKSFVENPWAGRAAGYLPAIKTLSAAKWASLIELTKPVIKSPEVLVAAARDQDDPRSQVLLSDDENVPNA